MGINRGASIFFRCNGSCSGLRLFLFRSRDHAQTSHYGNNRSLPRSPGFQSHHSSDSSPGLRVIYVLSLPNVPCGAYVDGMVHRKSPLRTTIPARITGNPEVMTASEVKSYSSIDRFLVVFHSPTGMAETGPLAGRSEKTGRGSRCNADTKHFQ